MCYDHVRAAVTIDLSMVGKCVMVGCLLINVFKTEVGGGGGRLAETLKWSCFQVICCCECNESETIHRCIVSCSPDGYYEAQMGEWGAVDLDRMRKRAPVTHTWDTLVIFSLTDSNWETNLITEMIRRHQMLASSASRTPSPGGVFPLQLESLLGSHIHNSASEGKLI